MKINEDESDEYLFSSCEINWEIENFCFAYPYNNCSIPSTDFRLQGLKSVSWRLSLELEDEKLLESIDIEMSKEDTFVEMSPEDTYVEMSPENIDTKEPPVNGVVSFYLEVLPTSLTKNVVVDWEMEITIGVKKFGPYEKKVIFLEQESSKHGHIGIATTKEFLENLLPLKHDVINVRFYFVAFDKNKSLIPKDEKPLGMSLLHKDLKAFKDMERNYSDIQLKVKDKYIEGHKIVLSCNEKFDMYIKQADSDVVEILNFDYKTMNAFVNFLYSRDAMYCFEDLSVSMIRCLDHFNCDALKPYYFPEELPLNSKIQIKKHEFQWYVPDILDRDSFSASSPPINFLDSNTTWQLAIFMRKDKFISISAEIIEGDKPRYFSLDFALINESEKEFLNRRLVRNNQTYKNLGFDRFIKKQDLRENRLVTIGDCVGFLFRVRTSEGIQESSTGCHSMSFILRTKSKRHKHMSEKLLEFYRNEIYSDITLISNGKGLIRAHRFILAARSSAFRQKLENNENIISIYHIERSLLLTILKYMYTGVLEESGEEILKLSTISSPGEDDIPSLYEECEQYKRRINACYNVKRKY